MATPNVGILTNAGKNLIDQVNAGKTKIAFSKIVFSSMNNNQLTDDQIKALTTVAPQEIVVNNPEVTLDNGTGETRIRATGNNKALTDGVYVKTYAVYAKDDSGNEILYGITVSPNPNYLPEYDGVTPQAVTYSYKVNISNTSNITFGNSDDIYVSDTDLSEALQPYAKTVDVNQQLGTKVNVSDMRKPASDVAGIEEVNAKQDKIGYTPADDSKVVHTADMRKPASDVAGLEDVSTSVYQSGLANGTDIHTITKDGIYPLGFSYVNFIDSNYHWGTLQVINNNAVIIHIARIEGAIWFETCSGTPMSWQSWHKLSSDDKVAHLSGANNFDTVPTVNNNPLLLASSLPSDVARTGQPQTFTAAQTFSIAPVIKDASKDKGDNQAATMADLKSVEASAWHQLKEVGKLGGTLLYKIDQSSKRIYLLYSSNDINGINKGDTLADFSSIVNNIKTISGKLYNVWGADGDSKEAVYINLSIGSPASVVALDGMPGNPNDHYGFFDGTYFTYDSLVNS